MGAGLVRDDVEALGAAHQLGLDLRGVADQGDRERPAVARGLASTCQGFVKRVRDDVHVAHGATALGTLGIHLDDQGHAVVHGHGQRLGTAHAAEPGGEHHPAAQRAPEVLASDLGERLEGALQDPLRPDVDPRAGRHLPVHGQALTFQLAEGVPVRPLANQIGIGDENARRPFMGSEDRNRLAGLHQQRFVVLQPSKLPNNRLERVPGTRRSTGPAVHDQVVGPLGNLGIEVVHEHAQRGFLLPAPTADCGTTWRANEARRSDCHAFDPPPPAVYVAPIAAAALNPIRVA